MKRVLVVSAGMLVLVASLAQAAAEGGSKKGEWDFAGGAGYTKELNSGAPGGSIGAQGQAIYMVSPEFGVGPMVGFYVLGKQSGYSIDGTTSVDYTYTLIPITAQGEYLIPSQSNVKPYLMGGAGIYMNRVSVSSGSSSSSSSDSKFGFNVGAGLESIKNSMGYGAEVRFHLVTASSGGESGKMLSAMAMVHFH